jgi:hypothetical protein
MAGVREIAERLARIPRVVAVTLGGSRAAGTASDDSDWDFGLYYREPIDPADVRSLGWPGRVFAPGDWGRIVNGGAWLEVDGAAVDLIYRDLGEVERWTAEAEAGRFRIEREVGYVAGIPTYVLAGELATCEVLHGSLARPADLPRALRTTAPPVWRNLAAGALQIGGVHARRGDRVAALANLAQAVLATAHARLTAAGEWVLNEKGLVTRAGLDDAAGILADPTARLADLPTALADVLDLPHWGR